MVPQRPEAESDRVRAARKRAGIAARRSILASANLSRSDRELLLRAGYLRRLMKGWYLLGSEPRPGLSDQDLSDLPPSCFYAFLGRYLDDRLGERWCLSAESSLRFLLDRERIPERIVAVAEFGSTTHHSFPGLTALTVYRDLDRFPSDTTSWSGLRVMNPETALARLKPAALEREPDLMRRALDLVRQWPEFAHQLAEEGRVTAAVRMISELDSAGRPEPARHLEAVMAAAGHRLPGASGTTAVETGPIDPLEPYEQRLLDWRLALEGTLPRSPAAATSLLGLLSAAQEIVAQDALSSLQLSGFAVDRDLVLNALTEPERAAVAAGWPELDPSELRRGETHAEPLTGAAEPTALLALQGYVEAQKLVKRSIVRLLEDEPLLPVMKEDLPAWHAALLSPSADAGLVAPEDLGRWRRRAPTGGSARAAIPAARIEEALDRLWAAVEQVADPQAAAHLAHVALVRIAPFEAGNHRLARFAMNAVRTARRQGWLLLPGDRRPDYLAALATEPARSLALALRDLYA